MSAIIGLALSASKTHASKESLSPIQESFQQTSRHIQQGLITSTQQIDSELKKYELYPYLQAEILRKNFSYRSHDAVNAFFAKYDNSYVAIELHRDWMRYLRRHRHWHTLTLQDPALFTAKSQYCLRIQALLNTKHHSQAKQEFSSLWLTGESLPKTCDPVISQVRQAGFISHEMLWHRFALAMESENLKLARYLNRSLHGSQGREARKLMRLTRTPFIIYQSEPGLKPDLTAYVARAKNAARFIGIKRIAKTSPEQIELAFDNNHIVLKNLTASQIAAVKLKAALGFKQISTQRALNWLVKTDPTGRDSELLVLRIRYALAEKNWLAAQQWIAMLPQEYRQKDQWRYWSARTQQLSGKHASEENRNHYLKHYAKLAEQRSYYGFLAAEFSNSHYQFNEAATIHNERSTQPELLHSFAAVKRSIELFKIGEKQSAALAWYYATRKLHQSQWQQAADLAKQAGMHHQAILASARAKDWNNLDTRFPVVYENSMLQHAADNAINSNWLYAIARQESAFSSTAKSSAGAVGLLQMLPATAKQTARQVGLPFSTQRLLNPDYSITLGSRYLAFLMKRFDNNTVAATAAYNAGPRKVSKWLAEKDDELPWDAWIESIPYKETRHYVKTVLAYSVIYGYQRGTSDKISELSPSLAQLITSSKSTTQL